MASVPDDFKRDFAVLCVGPVAPGVVLGPFELRSQALAAEAAWLEEHL